MPFVVGLTGGIGSGKSTVAAMFASLGVPLLDLDRVGHELIAGDRDVQQRLLQAFGDDIRKSDGMIDRRRLAARAFASEEATAELNAIMHPAIWAREEKWLAIQAAPFLLVEASVLIESGAAERMDAVIVVLADSDVRRQRVRARPDAIDEAMFDTVMARQCDDEARLKAADYIIDNNGEMENLQAEVERLYKRLFEKFGS